MKIILLVALLGISGQVFAESDLETDDSFFKSSTAPYQDDELDRIHKKNDLSKTTEQNRKTENKVKDEFSSTTPNIMNSSEARAMDQRVVTENKRRQRAILNKLASSTGLVYECINKDPKNFQGTHATLIWMIGPDGRVLDAAVKSTDIESNEIQKCIHSVAVNLKFDEAKTDLYKKSHVEYTYKFKKRMIKSAGLKRPSRRTASQASH